MSVWKSLAGNPLRFLSSSWPWRALAYLVTGAPIGLLWLYSAVALSFLGLFLAIGVGLLICVPLSAVALAVVERHRLRWLDPRPTPSAHVEVLRPGRWAWVWLRLRETATWRELGYASLFGVLSIIDAIVVVAVVVDVVFVAGAPAIVAGFGSLNAIDVLAAVDTPGEAWRLAPVGVVMAVLSAYLVTILAGAQAALARMLLVRPATEELSKRLVEVTASRARIADAFEAERRRIERDLHDGAQQRLTGLIMTLGLARLDGDRALIAKAQDEARAALDELRDLVHGIHPSVLTDRGLRAAVESLAERSRVPVDVDVDLPGRLPEAVESAAYFVIAEALANVAKHSGARQARVFIRQLGRLLVVEVHDDGTGGADPDKGNGLRGLADRVAVHDGTVKLSSPAGGPTIIRVQIPCAP